MAARATTTEDNPQLRGNDASKRQAITEAARALFTTRGYEATTMAEVAREAGVAVGTVYLYFKNKNDLLYAIKGDWEGEFLQALTQPEIQALPHHLRARPLMEGAFALCRRHVHMIQLMDLQPEMIGEWHSPEGESVVIQAVQQLFEDGIAAGSFRPLDTKAAAVLAFGMVNHALQQAFVIEGGKNQDRYLDSLVDTLEHWLVRPELLAEIHPPAKPKK